MKILIIGQGGREHELAWKVAQSIAVTQLFVAPGNSGMTEIAECVMISVTDVTKLVSFAQQQQIDLTIVGPEASLEAGLVDAFMAVGLRIWRPTKKAAQIETSKYFAKELMHKYHVATAKYRCFTDIEQAQVYVRQVGLPLVIKADGLAAGKGVVIPNSITEAEQVIVDMLGGNAFGDAGSSILIEEFLEGEEFSFIAFVHQQQIYPMPCSRS